MHMSEPKNDDEVAGEAESAVVYYRKLIVEGISPADAVRMTAAWIGSQEIARMFDEKLSDKEPWET